MSDKCNRCKNKGTTICYGCMHFEKVDNYVSVLKSCPFCGCEAVLEERGDPETDEVDYYVHCTKCGCEVSYYTHSNEAIEAWNTRV